MSAITQTSSVNKTSFTTTWTSPSSSGTYNFVATLLFSFETFWIIKFEESVTVTRIIPYNYDECGKSRSCMGKPDNCVSNEDCDILLTFHPSDEEDGIEFEMLYYGEGYVSVGFSNDTDMGADSVLECLETSSGVIMYASTNDGHHNTNAGADATFFTQYSGSAQDGVLSCSFYRPLSTTVAEITTDLKNKEYYILLAAGPLNDDGTDIGRHTERYSSSKAIDLSSDTFIIVDEGTTTTPSSETTTSGPSVIPYEYEECGKSRSCMGEPEHCVLNEACNILLTYHPSEEEDGIEFEMLYAGKGYVSIGFSDDFDKMGEDSVLECLETSSGVIMYASTNDDHHNTNAGVDSAFFTQRSGSFLNGILSCSFYRPLSTTVGEITTDLKNTEYYILLAVGPLNSDGTDIAKHTIACSSSSRVDFSSDTFIIVDEGTTTASPETTTGTSTGIDYNYEECGNSRSCMGDSADCVADENCHILLTYRPSSDEGMVDFEMMYSGDGYVSVGFSSDQLMGDDSVLECLLTSSGIIMYASTNDGHHNTNAGIDSQYFCLKSSSNKNGVIRCDFARPLSTTVDSLTTDFAKDEFHILLAVGPLNDDGTDIGHHTVTSSSTEAVDLSSHDYIIIGGGEANPTKEVMVHGCFMVVAWVLTSSLAIFLARYYKDMWPDKTHCNVKIWFAWHRGLNIVTVILTLTSLILIVVYTLMNDIKVIKYAHPIVGIVTVFLMVLQPVGALFRPLPGTPNRPIFNWLHFLGGMAACACGVVTMFLAVPMKAAHLPDYFYWILTGYVGFCAIMVCSMELAKHCWHHDEGFAINDNGDAVKPELKMPKAAAFKKAMLLLFGLGCTGFAIALMVVICT